MRLKDSTLSQLHDYLAWSSTGASPGEVSLLDYVGFVATPDSIFAFAELFSPELTVHNGFKFLASGFSLETYNAWEGQGTSPKEIQRVMNHLHISTLLQQQEITDEVAVEAARAIAAIWSKTIGGDELEVEVLGSCLSDAAVTFSERRSAC